MGDLKLTVLGSVHNRFLYSAPEKNIGAGFYFKAPTYSFSMTYSEFIKISKERDEINRQMGYPEDLLRSRKVYNNDLDTSNLEGRVINYLLTY